MGKKAAGHKFIHIWMDLYSQVRGRLLSLIGSFESLRSILIGDFQKRRIYIIHKKNSSRKSLLHEFMELFIDI